MNNFINQQALLEGVDTKVKQEYAKLEREAEQWIKRTSEIFPWMTYKKDKVPAPAWIDNAPKQVRFYLSWNKKPLMGVFVGVDAKKDGPEPMIHIGVDGRGPVKDKTKLATLFDNKYNEKGGLTKYTQFKKAFDTILDYLPEDEIPEEYHK